MRLLQCSFAVVFCILLFATPVQARNESQTNQGDFQGNFHAIFTTPMYTLWDFFGVPDARGFTLTYDGTGLLYLAPVRGIQNIFHMDLYTGDVTQLTFETQRSIPNFVVAYRYILFTRDTQGDEIHQLHRVSPDGTVTNLTPFPGVITNIAHLMDGREILITMNKEQPERFNIYRMNLSTGAFKLEVKEPMSSFLMDHNRTIRVLTILDGINVFVYYRKSAQDAFTRIHEWHPDERAQLLHFDANNEYVYAISNIGRNTSALVLMHPVTGEEKQVLYHRKDVDISSAFFSAPGNLAQVMYHTDKPEWYFFCEELEAISNQIYALFDENYHISFTSFSYDWTLFTVMTESDISRGGIYLVDLILNEAYQLLCRNGNINPEHMSPMHPIEFTARDGLTIPGYLTLPNGFEPRNLPLVVMPHGGPWVRDTWGWDSTVQFLANRGYAVFQPNFRGSRGFGREFLQASYGQWGLTMQDDITDGVLWLIAEGIVDPARVAIYGASYGGYAALAGAAFTPELYTAVISLVGVSNIFTWLEAIPAWWEPERAWSYERIGHPVYDYERLRATSPVFHADNIVAPMFIAHGANDPRVRLEESQQIVDALTERGIDVEFFIAWDEGHGFRNFRNIQTFFTVMEAFLAEHIGGRSSVRLSDIPRPLTQPQPRQTLLTPPAPPSSTAPFAPPPPPTP